MTKVFLVVAIDRISESPMIAFSTRRGAERHIAKCTQARQGGLVSVVDILNARLAVREMTVNEEE